MPTRYSLYPKAWLILWNQFPGEGFPFCSTLELPSVRGGGGVAGVGILVSPDFAACALGIFPGLREGCLNFT